MPRPSDTDIAADAMQIEIIRKMPAARRLELTFQLSAEAWNMARAAFDRLYPNESVESRDLRFFSSLYGDELAQKFLGRRDQLRNGRSI